MKGFLILIALIVVAALFCGVLPAMLQPALHIPAAALPVIQLPAEKLTAQPLINLPGDFNDIYLTNTLVATIIADLIVLIVAFFATRNLQMIPGGLQNVVEMIIDLLNGFTEQVAGKNARRIFPWMATIFIFLLVANWMELIPGVDSIGLMHHPENRVTGHRVAEIGTTGIYYLDVSTTPEEKGGIVPTGGDASTGEAAHEAACGVGDICVVTPFVRAAATDLNLTLALAIIAVIAVQVFGVEALGVGYFAKFINTPALEHGGMGYMDFVVGLLEIISELAKIISLAFRLFGNIFAGQVLLFVLAFLIPYLLPIPFFALEIFVGAMQAFVFAMLMLVFASMAMIPHHAEEEGAH